MDYMTRILALIDAIATFYDVPPLLGRAMVAIESGFDPNIVGDSGHSVGLCQLHDQGQGAGLCCSNLDWRYAEPCNLGVSFWHMHNTPHDGISWGEWAAKSQRPYDPVGYAAQIEQYIAENS
jgi:hypothetical protein